MREQWRYQQQTEIGTRVCATAGGCDNGASTSRSGRARRGERPYRFFLPSATSTRSSTNKGPKENSCGGKVEGAMHVAGIQQRLRQYYAPDIFRRFSQQLYQTRATRGTTTKDMAGTSAAPVGLTLRKQPGHHGSTLSRAESMGAPLPCWR